MELLKKNYDFYKLDKILSKNALYNIIYGQRANGKSYAVKKWCISESYLYDRYFTLCFRFKEDKKTNAKIASYFDDAPISKITKGEYDGIKVKSDILYFTYTDDKGKVKYGKQAGYVAFVDCEEQYKSLPFDKNYNIIYEEFISRRMYIVDEVTKFQSLVSTLLRLRINDGTQCRVFLIGNLISQVNPYRLEWNLNKLENQKPDTIDEYIFITPTGQVKIAAERCKQVKSQGGIAVSKKAQQQETGEWETAEVPIFNRDNMSNYYINHTFVYTYMGSYFLCRFLTEKNNTNSMFIYIEKKTTPIKKDTRVIGDIYDTSVLYTSTFKPLVDRERIVFDLLKAGKVCFSDRLTGTNFYTCYNTMMKTKTLF